MSFNDMLIPNKWTLLTPQRRARLIVRALEVAGESFCIQQTYSLPRIATTGGGVETDNKPNLVSSVARMYISFLFNTETLATRLRSRTRLITHCFTHKPSGDENPPVLYVRGLASPLDLGFFRRRKSVSNGSST